MNEALINKTNKQINKENFWVTFLLIFKSTQASVLAFSPVTTVLFLGIVIYIFNKRQLRVEKSFFNFSAFYLVIHFIYFFDFGFVDVYLSSYIYLKFLFAYLSIKIVGFTFFKNFQKIVYFGALISIPLFLLQILAYDFLFDTIGLLQKNISLLSFRNDRFANIFFFTIDGYGAKLRNSGFMWEPKGYANVLILAMIFNLIRHKFKITNKQFIVLFIALLTTQSTTGFLIVFIVFPLFYFVNTKKASKLFFALAAIISLSIISQLGFMLDKIKYELTLTDEYETLVDTKRDYDRTSISLGRVGSFIVDFEDFKRRPIFGYGFQKDERTQNKWIKLVRVNGFSDLLATYGLVGLVFYGIRYQRFYKILLGYYKLKGTYILLLMTLIIYFASTLTAHPLWMSFLFMRPHNLKNENIINSISRP